MHALRQGATMMLKCVKNLLLGYLGSFGPFTSFKTAVARGDWTALREVITGRLLTARGREWKVYQASSAAAVDPSSLFLPGQQDLSSTNVIILLRHFACPFCWELLRQAQQELLPKLKGTGVRVSAVGIGTPDKAAELATSIGWPPEHLYADPEAVMYSDLGLERGFNRLYFSAASYRALREKDKQQRLLSVLSEYKWGMVSPRTFVNHNLQQGGCVVVKDGRLTFVHADEGTGAHVSIGDILAALNHDEPRPDWQAGKAAAQAVVGSMKAAGQSAPPAACNCVTTD